MTVTLRSDLAIQRLAQLPQRMRESLRVAVKTIAYRHAAEMRTHFSGRPGLISRSGTLRDSFTVLDSEDEDGPMARVVSRGGAGTTLTGQPYGGVQEGDGVNNTTITPKNVRALTIPLPWNKGPDGLPKYRSAAQLRAQGRTRLVKAKDGRTYIMVREDRGYVPMWILKSSAQIPPRLDFIGSFKRSKGSVQDEINSAIKGAL